MRRSFKAGAVAAVAAAAFAVSSGTAFASSFEDTYVYGPGSTFCYASVSLTGANQDYAQGYFENDDTGHMCSFMLERAYITNGVLGSFSPIGSYGTNPDVLISSYQQDKSMSTGQYWDGPDVRVIACIDMTGSDAYGYVWHDKSCTKPV